MPGVKTNKAKNFAANQAWKARKCERNASDTIARTLQRIWRIGCLRTRLSADKLTTKNQKERETLNFYEL